MASLQRAGAHNIVHPSWLFHCVEQARADSAQSRQTFRLPYEPDDMYYMLDGDSASICRNVDEFGDSYARDYTTDELVKLLDAMPKKEEEGQDIFDGTDELEMIVGTEDGEKMSRGAMFDGLVLYIPSATEGFRVQMARNYAKFAGAKLAHSLDDESITHVVVAPESASTLADVRRDISSRPRIPRFVSLEWVEECWREETQLDEERHPVVLGIGEL